MGVEVSGRVLRRADEAGRYVRLSGREDELRQVLFGGGNLAPSWSLEGSLPFVQTHRQVAGDTEWGGGVGDALGALRWRWREVDTPGPGVVLEGRLTVPTGRSPSASVERGRRAWMTDVTGTGVWTPGFGLRLGHLLGPTHGEWSAALDWPTARDAGGRRFRPGPLLSTMLEVGAPVASLGSGGSRLLVAGSVGMEARGRVRVEGEAIAGTSERRTSMAGVLGLQGERWYGGVRLGADLPVDPLTRESLAGAIGSLTLRRDFRPPSLRRQEPPRLAGVEEPW